MKIHFKFVAYYIVCLIVILLQILNVYDSQNIVLTITGVLCFIKIITTVGFPNMLSNSYDTERLSKEQQKHSVISYKNLFLMIFPLLLIIIISS